MILGPGPCGRDNPNDRSLQSREELAPSLVRGTSDLSVTSKMGKNLVAQHHDLARFPKRVAE